MNIIKITIWVIILSLSIQAQETANDKEKSWIVAEYLNFAVPFGGLGFSYLGVWNQEYGNKMLITQSALFTSGVVFTVLGHYNSNNTDCTPSLFANNGYGITGLAFFALWAGTQYFSAYKIDKICSSSLYGIRCSF